MTELGLIGNFIVIVFLFTIGFFIFGEAVVSTIELIGEIYERMYGRYRQNNER